MGRGLRNDDREFRTEHSREVVLIWLLHLALCFLKVKFGKRRVFCAADPPQIISLITQVLVSFWPNCMSVARQNLLASY